jgi:hypothetical protein
LGQRVFLQVQLDFGENENLQGGLDFAELRNRPGDQVSLDFGVK